jgi:O-antigen ligase
MTSVAASSRTPSPSTPTQAPSTGSRSLATRLTKDPYRLAMLVLIVLSISKLPGYFSILRLLRPSFLLFGFCLIYAFANPSKLAAGSILRFWPARIVAALAVAACCSAVFGLSLGRSANFIVLEYWKTLAFTFLLMTGVRNATDLRRMVTAVAVGGIVLAYLSVFVVGISKTSSAVTYDANDVGLIMVTSLPLVLLVLQSSRGKTKLVALIGLALIGSTIAKTQSRGAFLGALMVGAGLLFLLPGVAFAKRVLSVAAAVAMMALTAPPGYWESMQSILSDPKSDYNYDAVNGRRNIAKRGVGYMLAYPVFGIGINNFPLAEGTISDKARNTPAGHGIRWAAAHNSYVQAGAETGFIGFALWASLLVGGIGGCYRLRRRMPRIWMRHGTPDQRFLYLATAYIPIAFLGFAITASFVSFAWTEPIYILSALVFGMYVAHEEITRASAGTAMNGPAGPVRRRSEWRTAASLG